LSRKNVGAGALAAALADARAAGLVETLATGLEVGIPSDAAVEGAERASPSELAEGSGRAARVSLDERVSPGGPSLHETSSAAPSATRFMRRAPCLTR
jgi:hypothetical protein